MRTSADPNTLGTTGAWFRLAVIAGPFAVLLALAAAIHFGDARFSIADPESAQAESRLLARVGAETATELARPSSQFVEQELNQLRSPFTKERVLELNAIVDRSLQAIGKFDGARKRLETGQESTAQTAATLVALAAEAKEAQLQMAAAKARLVASGEHYNESILAAMVRFVEDVDQEIGLEAARVDARQNIGGRVIRGHLGLAEAAGA